MRDDPNAELKCLTARSPRSHKRCWFIKTAGRWPWKSEPAKECVTTHLPKVLALKMDGAQADHRGVAAGASARRPASRRARSGRRSLRREPE